MSGNRIEEVAALLGKSYSPRRLVEHDLSGAEDQRYLDEVRQAIRNPVKTDGKSQR